MGGILKTKQQQLLNIAFFCKILNTEFTYLVK